MRLSVVIATKDRTEPLRRCLDSLTRQELLPDEVVIVDASNPPLTPPQNLPFPARTMWTRPGLTRQRNAGIEASTGDIVLYLDDDVALEPGYLTAIIEAFQADGTGRVGAATGRITNLSQPGPWHPLRSLLWVFNLVFQLPDFGSGRFRLTGFPTFPYHRTDSRYVEALSGCNMAFRRRVLQEFHFDENLVGYGYMEDDDMAYRVSRRYRCVYVPEARLAHHTPPRARQNLRAHKRMLAANYFYLFRKNIPRSFRSDAALGVSIVGLIVSTLLVEQSLAGALGLLDGLRAARQV